MTFSLDTLTYNHVPKCNSKFNVLVYIRDTNDQPFSCIVILLLNKFNVSFSIRDTHDNVFSYKVNPLLNAHLKHCIKKP